MSEKLYYCNKFSIDRCPFGCRYAFQFKLSHVILNSATELARRAAKTGLEWPSLVKVCPASLYSRISLNPHITEEND